MCIIIIKPAGIPLPSIDTLETCYINNPDGVGFMYPDGGAVRIEKGLMKWKTFKAALDALKKKKNLLEMPVILHFRITTSGGTMPENCHPFPVSDTMGILKKLTSRAALGIAHNGMIPIDTRAKDISDTMEYTVSQLAPLYRLKKDFYKTTPGRELVSNAIQSKMAFMDASGYIATIGDFIEKDGVKYSNTSYLPYISYSSWDIWGEYSTKDANFTALMLLDDTDGYVIHSDGSMDGAGDYAIDSSGGLYWYDWEADAAVKCAGRAVSHTGGAIPYEIDLADYVPVYVPATTKKTERAPK